MNQVMILGIALSNNQITLLTHATIIESASILSVERVVQ